MKTLALKEKGLMETLLLKETETISTAAAKIGTEQIPHWKSDDSVCGYMRKGKEGVGISYSEVIGHQRPC
jgi:hypothetical protein